ncbi:PAS domain-containing sensor histidine kinase [Rivularia sp. UHCC 0363]|uniref:sensor histidine kinase n=1 Tax=Rivularia sp. UHCC 0363 TaxID=3110244 RepID=UPI002B1F0AF9|nr:PAS domain-containing sensor histidine kinase [Rivularia sp. UHCC 0363]MEA5595360.1 PAS domain-containing sensor histidine kinase [Rivularia sp. UHCC 0363]
MSVNQSFNCYQTRQKNLVSAKSASLEFVPETTSNLEICTAEALCRTQEELDWYRNLYDQNPGIYFTLDSTGIILSVNQFGAKRLGYVPRDLNQTLIFNLFAFFEREKLSELLTGLLKNTSGVADEEFCLNCPDSNIVWVKVTARKSLDASQNLIILMVCEDITAYKSQVSNPTEPSFLEFADRTPVMLWMTNEKGVHNFFNSSWLKLTGRKIEQELAWGWLENLHPEDKNTYLSTYFQAIKQQQKFEIEYRLKRADGDYRWICDRGVPRFSSNDNFIGYMGSCIDITECKQAEVAVRESQIAAKAQLEEMESLNRLKDEFLSTVSHELRTPLTNMKMAIQMLGIKLEKQPQPNDTSESVCNSSNIHQSKVSRYFQILNNECEREISLINNFLDLQRLDTIAKPLVLEKVEVSQWLERVVELYHARNRNCCRQNMKLYLQPNLPSIVCDPFSLERILVELLTNACKFSPTNQEIIVSALVKSDNIQFQVINTGVEIPAAELPRIFDKFYRIPSNDPWKQGGTGLGLALVQKLTKHLGGIIEVESSDNRTIFSIELPLER